MFWCKTSCLQGDRDRRGVRTWRLLTSSGRHGAQPRSRCERGRHVCMRGFFRRYTVFQGSQDVQKQDLRCVTHDYNHLAQHHETAEFVFNWLIDIGDALHVWTSYYFFLSHCRWSRTSNHFALCHFLYFIVLYIDVQNV